MKRFLGVLFALLLAFSLAAVGLPPPVQAATFTVNSTADTTDANPGDGICDDGTDNCTLRAAIMEANILSGPHMINFAIPGAGSHKIQPLSALPTVTEPVIIDGYTQSGASPNTNPPGSGSNAVLMIELDGSNAGAGVHGLYINAGSSTVQGLVINRFARSGIYICCNDVTGVLVQGNFIGTDITGTAALGNQHGVELGGASSVTIGGATSEAHNIISGNDLHGIKIWYASTTGILVQGNFIGTDVTGMVPLGNGGDGVRIGTGQPSDTTIGGTASGAGNTIAFNDGHGISLVVGIGDPILSNSIFANGGLGIDLGDDGATPNDVGDNDTGANNLQNFPVLTSATSGSSTIIKGTLNSTSDTECRVEFFSNSSGDPSGYGEGENFLGAIDVTTDGNGDTSFVVTFPDAVPAGQFITATATDSNNNTSEFSECVLVCPEEVWVDDDYCDGCPNDGHTWGYDAFATIQDGIDAVAGSIVHVAAGTYYENITLKDGVQVLGAGAAVTIIDGNTARDGQPAYHVVVGADNATLDGFTVTGGNANGSGNDRYGGGMFNAESSPTVTNCTFSGNSADSSGGGMYNSESLPTVDNCEFSGNWAWWGSGMYNSNSSPMVTDCTFADNTVAGVSGGIHNHFSSPTVDDCIFSANYGSGISNHDSSPIVTNCTFSTNLATYGGGISNWDSSPVVTNCTFTDNSATWGGGIRNGRSSAMVTNCIFSANSALYGGGMENWKSSAPMVTNCTFTDNSATYGGGISNWDSLPVVTNCILWANGEEIRNTGSSVPEVAYCDVQGGYPGGDNITDADPMFVDPTGGDYHLECGSPCIDAGTNDALALPATDFDGDPRILPVGGVVDMGADEYMPPPAIDATVDFDPDTLHLVCDGRIVTVYIELPMGYDVGQIDVSTIVLNGVVPALEKPIEVGDHDSDGMPDLMVKFDRSDVQDALEPGGDEVEVTVSGRLTDCTPFEGTDTIRTIK